MAETEGGGIEDEEGGTEGAAEAILPLPKPGKARIRLLVVCASA